MPHEPRLMQSLRALLASRRTAALGTTPENATAGAAPLVSFVPFALDADSGTLVLHVSGLAAHARNLQAHADVALLVTADEAGAESVLGLERVTITGRAAVLAREADTAARLAFLARFPEAEPMTHFGDFRFVAITPLHARHVAGFGAARDVDQDELRAVLRPASAA